MTPLSNVYGMDRVCDAVARETIDNQSDYPPSRAVCKVQHDSAFNFAEVDLCFREIWARTRR